MKIYIGADHAGYKLKNVIVEHLESLGYEVIDVGAHEYDPLDDYPDFVSAVARLVSDSYNDRDYGASEDVFGIVLGGSGQGEAIVANRFEHVRAVVYFGEPIINEKRISDELTNNDNKKEVADALHIIELSRKHNNANVLSLGARFLTDEQAMKAVSKWLSTSFSNEIRHVRRIEKIEKITKDI